VTVKVNELYQAGLVTSPGDPHLSDKGREWLGALENMMARENVDLDEAAADLVLSTNGLFR
jgi:hypothetical protein